MSSAKKAVVAQALKAERSITTAASQKQALEAAIDAAESYLKALRLSDSVREKQQLDAKCKELIAKAEQIKRSKSWQPACPENRDASNLEEPASTRKLSTREEIILLEGAKLNGFLFPPWVAAPDPEEFELDNGKKIFIDKPDLTLSSSQWEIFNGWKRPHELLSGIDPSHETDTTASMMPELSTVDLSQDVTTDCSVVASLCAATSRVERGHSQLFDSRIYPFDDEGQAPKLSPSGRYIFRFHFNGCYRKVVIDDRLPSSKTTRSLHVIDRNNPRLLWPALIEKAYLKVRGGYDFPGSNSGTDLWVLSGWIPEQVFLHRGDVTSEQLWKRLFTAFRYGDVLLTIGTGNLSEKEQKLLGLISQHDYAVLDMKESNGCRQMLIKNPWAETKIHSARDSIAVAMGTGSEQHGPHGPGCFWMDCKKVFQNFDNLYLNWNPCIFRYREDMHFSWDLLTGRGTPGCFATNPQFAVSSHSGGSVWLLLCKHFRPDEKFKLQSLLESHLDGNEPEFISIYVYKKDGQKVYLSDGAIHRGPYVDSPNTLMRVEMPANTAYTIVTAEQSLPLLKQNFTLSAFSTAPVNLTRVQDKYGHTSTIKGNWTSATAGGNAESAKYPSNPQFSLHLPDMADVSILLETPKPDLAVHVKLFWSNGKRVSSFRKRDIVTDSGDYRPGCAVAETDQLGIGQYTIVCSTFAPDQLASFTLSISSTIQCDVEPLAAEAAGRRVVISDIGVFHPGTDRILASLSAPRLTRVKLIARSRGSTIGSRAVGPSPMLMSVELGQGPYKEILARSGGEYSDAISGIRVDDFDLQPELGKRGGAWIVLERINSPGGCIEDHIEVEALAEERVEIGEWTT